MELKSCLADDNKLLQRVAVVSLFPMLISPLIQFLRNILQPPRDFGMFGEEVTYATTIELVNAFATAGILLLWGLFLYTIAIRRYAVQGMARRYLSQILFLILIIWAVSSSLILGHVTFFTEGAPFLYESMMTFVLYFAGYFFAGMMLSKELYRRIVIWTIISAGTLLGTLSLVHFYICSLSPAFYDNGVSAVFYNPNHYAYFLTMCILLAACCFVFEKNRIAKAALLFSFICNSVVLNINNTLGCFLAVLFSLVLFVLLTMFAKFEIEQRRLLRNQALFLLGLYVGIMVVMSLFYNTILRSILVMFFDISKILTNAEDVDKAGSSRWRLWRHTVQYISEKPIFGHGVDEIGTRLHEDAGFSRSHNEYLQYTVFWGIPALLMYLCACGTTIIRALKQRVLQTPYLCAALIAAVGYMASAFFGNTKYYTAPFFFVLLGIAASGVAWSGLGETRENKYDSNNRRTREVDRCPGAISHGGNTNKRL
ncbi:MAG: O-antigen ligase family protein [Lachnospiraceae bacterium]|nr:O-antigen ligase family protein [Lachnospiraceae bacterium]